MTHLAGRDVYLVAGRLTQTINICDASNRRGCEFYDWIVRIAEPFINESDVAAQGSVFRLVEWLRKRGGIIEKHPPEGDPPPMPVVLPASEYSVDEPSVPWTDWIERAIEIVEQCIDRLVIEFLEHPSLHRVEHSIHAELFAMLSSHRHFSQRWPLADGKTFTQLVHKEWPETIPRPEKGNRRGNFDLAILSPGVVAQCHPQTFSMGLAQGGVARPCIAIEAGLNYSQTHLAKDADKLANSVIAHGYLIHLVRDSPPELAEVTSIIEKVEPEGTCRIAYAVAGQTRKYRKLLGEREIKVV